MNRITCTFLAFSLCACGSSPERVTQPAAPTPAARPEPPIPQGPRLSGVVFEALPQGRRMLPESRVSYGAEDGTSGSVLSDAEGRYSIVGVPAGRVRITAFADWKMGPLFQRTAAIATVAGAATSLDIELVASGVRGDTYGAPTLTGVVYRVGPGGRQPVANTRVFYKSFAAPPYDVYLETDEQGRFDFSRLPLGAGRLGAGNCNDQAMFVPVEITGDTTADMDLTPLFTACPGVPF